MFGRTAALFHSTAIAFETAEAAQPFAAIFAHQGNNAVADLEEPLLEHGLLLRVISFSASSWAAASIAIVIAFKRALQIRDRHPDLVHIFVAQGGGQFGAGQRRVSRQFDRRRLVLERGF